MDKPLLLLTKILLALWAVVTIPAGLLLIFYPPLANSIVWPPPLEAIPPFHAQLNGAIGIGTGVASVVALQQNRWGSARPMVALYITYALSAEYVALTQVASAPVPLQVWFYVILGGFYLVSSSLIWGRQ